MRPLGYRHDGCAGENQPGPSDRLHNAAPEAERHVGTAGWVPTASDSNRWAQPGKWSQLAPEVQDRLLDAIRDGVPVAHAVTYAGIGGATFYR